MMFGRQGFEQDEDEDDEVAEMTVFNQKSKGKKGRLGRKRNNKIAGITTRSISSKRSDGGVDALT